LKILKSVLFKKSFVFYGCKMNFDNTIRNLFVFGALMLAACGGFSEDRAEVLSPPPANETEIIPAIQDPRAEIWRPGYLAPDESGGFDWVDGEVIPRPSPTAVWATARWAHHVYGWTFEQGHWE
jgi:hypothetical protein